MGMFSKSKYMHRSVRREKVERHVNSNPNTANPGDSSKIVRAIALKPCAVMSFEPNPSRLRAAFIVLSDIGRVFVRRHGNRYLPEPVNG
jgi:hypothetical protein